MTGLNKKIQQRQKKKQKKQKSEKVTAQV